MSTFMEVFNQKLVTADEAVKCVKSGDRVQLGEIATTTPVLEAALARRKDELYDVNMYCSMLAMDPVTLQVDPEGEHFTINDISFGGIGRKYQDAGKNYYHIPLLYHEMKRNYELNPIDVAFISVCPMDKHGYFNFGPVGSITAEMRFHAKKIVLEINDSMPMCYGGQYNCIHVSEVDYIVQGENQHLVYLPKVPSTPEDDKIAEIIMNELEDGMCLQLGIGGMPNKVGEMIAKSDLKDLGAHSEMMCDSFKNIFETGQLTNARKTVSKGRSVYTFAMGSKELYDWIDCNPMCELLPVHIVNDPFVIAQNDKVASICSCLNVDLYGQVSAESVGSRQISGTGGQLDFVFASYRSKGGKGFVCLNTKQTKRDGSSESKILPMLKPNTIVTLPRTVTFNVVSEYGIVNLKGKSTWERAEALISISHPDFRDDLIKEAEALKIWRKSQKR